MTRQERIAEIEKRAVSARNVTLDKPKTSLYAEYYADDIPWLLSQLTTADAGRDGWQPIETAPKDGTHVLAVLDGNLPPTTVHWFGPADLPGLRAGGWYLSVQQNEGPRVHPTHWRPLSAAPTAKKED